MLYSMGRKTEVVGITFWHIPFYLLYVFTEKIPMVAVAVTLVMPKVYKNKSNLVGIAIHASANLLTPVTAKANKIPTSSNTFVDNTPRF